MIERHEIHDRAQWLSLRSTDLTASDLGAAMGIDRFKSALELYGEKTGLLMPQADNDAMQRGRWLEPGVIAALSERHPDWQITYPLKDYYRDPELHLGATPDAEAEIPDKPGKTNVQCKVVARPAFEEHWSAGPPVGYLAQVACENMLMDVERGLIACLVIDTHTASLHTYPVERHQRAEQRVREEAATFWSNVRQGLRPRADPARDAEIVAAFFPVAQKEPVLDLTGNNRITQALLDERAGLKDAETRASERIREIDTVIKDVLGPHARASLPGWKLSWPTITRKAYEVAASTFRGGVTVTKVEEA